MPIEPNKLGGLSKAEVESREMPFEEIVPNGDLPPKEALEIYHDGLSPKGRSRRFFITRVIPGVAIVAVGAVGVAKEGPTFINAIKPAFIESDEAKIDTLRSEIEGEFAVKITQQDKRFPLTIGYLRQLRDDLRLLPRNLMARAGDTSVLPLAINYQPEEKDILPINIPDTLEQPSVTLSSKSFSPKRLLSSWSNLVYRVVWSELPYRGKFGSLPDKDPISQLQAWENALVEATSNPLGATIIEQPTDSLSPIRYVSLQMDKLRSALGSQGILAEEDKPLWNELLSAVDRTDMRTIDNGITYEQIRGLFLLPFLAAFYVRGKNYFMQTCGKFFGENVAVKMYGFIKTNLFKDREY